MSSWQAEFSWVLLGLPIPIISLIIVIRSVTFNIIIGASEFRSIVSNLLLRPSSEGFFAVLIIYYSFLNFPFGFPLYLLLSFFAETFYLSIYGNSAALAS